MIHDLDEAIRHLLVRNGGLDPSEVDIRFEIPDREWASTISKPTVNCYLYDIHENLQLAEDGWFMQRDGMSGVSRTRPPMHVDLSYLLTAWTKAVEDEHRLLWRVLAVLSSHERFPADVLDGEMADQQDRVFTHVAKSGGALRSPGEFWSALDNKLKPSLNYVVTVPLAAEPGPLTPLVLGAEVRTSQRSPDEPPPGTADVVGHVRDSGGRGVAAARLLFIGTNQAVTTDRDGRFAVRAVPLGRHVVAVAPPGALPREHELVVPAESYDLRLNGA
jgi:hypothetical protein